jgi:acetoin utilization deacetylase AcuC-like enzyme
LTLLVVEGAIRAADQEWTLDRTGARVPGPESDARRAAIATGLSRAGGSLITAESDDAELMSLLHVAHTPDYIAFLRETTRLPAGQVHMPHDWSAPGVPPDTPVHRRVWAEAFESARVALAAAWAVAAGEQVAYGLCRPPGHHAGPDWAGGYCFLNNAAIAVLLLSSQDRRPGVLDLDFHVGNGTAAILARIGKHMYTSVHAATTRHYPWQSELAGVSADNCVEFSLAPSGEQYLAAVGGLVERLVDHGIDTLVLSLGFDAIAGDPHGGWSLPPSIYGPVAALLSRPGWPVCIVQEGGYRLDALTDCAEIFGRGLTGALWQESRSPSKDQNLHG